MCGIIGYIGTKPVLPVLIDGLRRLEYRGYDSAGVAVVRNGQIELRRSAGKLARLEAVIDADPIDGEYGVGHTRWATHGRPTEENAHPHRDCTGRIVVVHNGIIENYLDLKRELQRDGHVFVTETDTEIVAHLVERETRDDGLEQAVRRALGHLQGLFAIVLMSTDDPGKDRGRAQRPARGHRDGRRRVLRRLGHPGDPEPHAGRRVPRRRGDGGRHPGGRGVHRRGGAPDLEAGAAGALGPDHGGARRLQALHAEGDFRAAARRARDHPGPRLGRAGPHLPRRGEPRRGRTAGGQQGGGARVRHFLARRPGRQAHDRAARAACRPKSTTARSTATGIRSWTSAR